MDGANIGPKKIIDEQAQKELDKMKEQLEANQRMMTEMEKTWEEKLAEERKRQEEEDKIRQVEEKQVREGKPHLLNMNEDPMLDRKVQYAIMPN